MNRTVFKFMSVIAFAAVITVVVFTLVSCRNADENDYIASPSKEIVVVVPSDGESTIASLISEYDAAHDDLSVKLINIGGTPEEIHRFCVSVLIDSKFNADLLIIDDVWLSEFASYGLVSEMKGVDGYDFIPAARSAMTFGGKVYGIPIYADAMVDFKKYESTSQETMYLDDNITDMSAYIRNEIENGLSLNEAYAKYKSALKSASLSDFAEKDIGTMRTWLSQNDVMQKYYPRVAGNMEIGLAENSLIKTKLAIISSDSNVGEAAVDIVKYLLKDDKQLEIMDNITGLPVMSKHYSDPFMLDKCHYIDGLTGNGFCTFAFSPRYNQAEIGLKGLLENNVSDEEIKKALQYLE